MRHCSIPVCSICCCSNGLEGDYVCKGCFSLSRSANNDVMPHDVSTSPVSPQNNVDIGHSDPSA
eukprot:2266544-Ditylum_brightwellii.AAC.1